MTEELESHAVLAGVLLEHWVWEQECSSIVVCYALSTCFLIGLLLLVFLYNV